MISIIRVLAVACLTAWPFTAVGQRVALVIGNGSYRSVAPLQNPPRDARAVGDVLRDLGFRVEMLLDADRASMSQTVRAFSSAANGADVAMAFYAGHAIEVRGRNMLLPVNISPNAALVEREALPYSEIETSLEGRAAATIIMLDSCRDSPFPDNPGDRQTRPRAGGRGFEPTPAPAPIGLAATSTASGILVAFATAPGRTALDGSGQNSPFTTALLQFIRTPDLEVRQMLGRVRRAVRESTGGHQIPWDNSSLEGEFFFRSSVAVPRAILPPRVAPSPPAPSPSPAAAAPPPPPVAAPSPPRPSHPPQTSRPADQVIPPASLERPQQAPAPVPTRQDLVGSDVAARLLGNTLEFEGSAAQRVVRAYFAPDGQAFIRFPPASGYYQGGYRQGGDFDRGNWELINNQFCVQWWWYLGGRRYCILLRDEGGSISYFRITDRVFVDASIRRGNPYGIR